MGITPKLKTKMLETIKKMKEKNISFMEVNGADGFFMTLNDNQLNAIVLGVEKVEEVDYFLCLRAE